MFAQPLLPARIKLSHSRDPEMRMVAYEAAFFTRPDKEIFLPLASQALKAGDQGVLAMARQWQEERFPDTVGPAKTSAPEPPLSVTNTVTAASMLNGR